MIQNDSELVAVLQQLSRIEEALASLRRDVLPKNERNFEVLSEGYVDQIAELRGQVNEYLAAASKTG